jgi:hypothetical protein
MAAKRLLQKLALGSAVFAAGAGVLGPLGAQQSENTNLGVWVGPECAVAVSSSTSVAQPDAYSGRITFSYKIRTSRAGGSGAIGLAFAGRDLSGATLAYTTALQGRGTPQSVGEAPVAGAPTAIATFGSNSHSGKDGDTGTVFWSLKNYRGAPPAVQLTTTCH